MRRLFRYNKRFHDKQETYCNVRFQNIYTLRSAFGNSTVVFLIVENYFDSFPRKFSAKKNRSPQLFGYFPFIAEQAVRSSHNKNGIDTNLKFTSFITLRRPCWCPKTKERKPYWFPQLILRELNSNLMQTFPAVK